MRRRIAAGTVYQVNLCRVLSHRLDEAADLDGLACLLVEGNPAPYAARVHVPEAGLDVVSASPEAFLARDGARLESRPIKGTAPVLDAMLAKDYAENVMIVDLVRNDLQRVCRPGSVQVDHLCAPEQHPGLVHLVSTVAGELLPGSTWNGLHGDMQMRMFCVSRDADKQVPPQTSGAGLGALLRLGLGLLVPVLPDVHHAELGEQQDVARREVLGDDDQRDLAGIAAGSAARFLDPASDVGQAVGDLVPPAHRGTPSGDSRTTPARRPARSPSRRKE